MSRPEWTYMCPRCEGTIILFTGKGEVYCTACRQPGEKKKIQRMEVQK